VYWPGLPSAWVRNARAALAHSHRLHAVPRGSAPEVVHAVRAAPRALLASRCRLTMHSLLPLWVRTPSLVLGQTRVRMIRCRRVGQDARRPLRRVGRDGGRGDPVHCVRADRRVAPPLAWQRRRWSVRLLAACRPALLFRCDSSGRVPRHDRRCALDAGRPRGCGRGCHGCGRDRGHCATDLRDRAARHRHVGHAANARVAHAGDRDRRGRGASYCCVPAGRARAQVRSARLRAAS